MITSARAIILGLLLGHGATLAADEPAREYTWLTMGKPSGTLVLQQQADGTTHMSFQFTDRGRGPRTQSSLRLNEHGVPVELEITGNNYSGGAVHERFSARDGSASWQSSIEEGEAAFDGLEFFLPRDAAPAFMAILARAIMQSASGAVQLLPAGRASISRLASRSLPSGDGSIDIDLYGIDGLGSTPSYVWLDRDRQFFGMDQGLFGITPKGMESHIDTLRQAQQQAGDDYYRTLAATLTTPLDGLLAIRGARIFDSVAGRLTQPATIFCWRGKISAIYFAEVAVPAGARVIDAGGKTIVPSLWDMHAHVSIENFPNYLAFGISNVRDMGNDTEVIYRLQEDTHSGRVLGPDIHALGVIDRRGEYAAPAGRLADSLQDALDMVDYYAQHGFRAIKLYSSIEPAWVPPIAQYAHQRGLPVMGHIPAFMNATQAIAGGFDEITHINMVLLNFLGAESLDTRTPLRFTVPGEQAYKLDLQSAAVQDFVALMKRRDIALDPTIAVFMDMFLNEPGKVSPIFRDIAEHLPVSVRRQAVAGIGRNQGREAIYAASAKRMQELLLLLHRQGIRLLPGTDNDLPGLTLIRELMYYVEAGIPAAQVLQMATIVAARQLGQEQRLGSVSVGKDAYFHVVDGDPVSDIGALYRVEQVVQGRRLFNAADILAAQGFVPFTRP
jgi:hypothetical protein